MHAPPQPHTPPCNHTCPLQPRMPPCKHACPQQPHMPLQPHMSPNHTPPPHMSPGNHTCPPPKTQAPQETMQTPPGNHARPPVNRITNRCKNITLPQTSFAGGKNSKVQFEQVGIQIGSAPAVLVAVTIQGESTPPRGGYLSGGSLPRVFCHPTSHIPPLLHFHRDPQTGSDITQRPPHPCG